MTNPEKDPDEIVCAEGDRIAGVEVVEPRKVPLGGPRAMLVRRTLPTRQRSLIGAWCFVDHYGPDRVSDSGGMSVAAHPHTGLATVSWLFTGEIEHRDSVGTVAMVKPGEVNLMTAGRGISHSEVSTPETTLLHGVQLWVALPEAARHVDPRFEHYVPEPVTGDGWTARVFLGELAGDASPVQTHTELLGAEVLVSAGATVSFDVADHFEHGVLLDQGAIEVEGQALAGGELGYLSPGCTTLTITAETDSRLVLLGGPPFGESIIMWWNFIGRTHEEVVEFREQWQAQVAPDGEVVSSGLDLADGSFGLLPDQPLSPIPAPPMPNARLRERR